MNVVHIGGFNDNEIHEFIKFTMEDEIDVRFIELMPIGETTNYSISQYVSNDSIISKLPNIQKLEYEDTQSPAVYYKLEGAKGRIGFISPLSHKFCNMCNRVRLTSTGELITCLHSDDAIDLKPYMEDTNLLIQAIKHAIENKPLEHRMVGNIFARRSMDKIGG